MFEHINEIAVVGCSLLLLAVYILWYTVFPQKGAQLPQVVELSTAGVSFLALSFVLAYLLSLLEISPMLFALVCAIVGSSLYLPVGQKHGGDMRAHLIHIAFISFASILCVLVLTYWPW